MSFDHGSTSDTGVDSQMSWNSIQASAPNWLPVYRMPSGPPNVEPLHHPGHAGLQNQPHLNENEKEHVLSVNENRLEPSNMHSLDNVEVSDDGNQPTNMPPLLQIPGPDSLPPDLNLLSEFGNNDCQDVHRSNTHLSIGSSKGKIPFTGSSSESLGISPDGPGCSVDHQRTSCKRKAIEMHPGQSSGSGSSIPFQYFERNQRHAIGVPIPAENEIPNNNASEQANPRLRLGVERVIAPSGSSSRNSRSCFGSLPPQDLTFRNSSPAGADDVGNVKVSSSSAPSGLVDINIPPHVGTRNFLSIPSRVRYPQSRWGGGSSSRTANSSTLVDSQERDDVILGESEPRTIPPNISEHAVFANETGSTTQQPNWVFANGSNIVAGNAASASRPDASAFALANWVRPQYTRRISDAVRRSLISSAVAVSGGPTISPAAQSNSPAASQGIANSSGSGNQAPLPAHSRSALLERHLDVEFRMSHLLRNLASAGEGRSNAMSEIRHVLDLMRRGEGLRIEDVMMLDHPALFGVADIHDRHRDMRLDVDNMSYEELLALEERIGNVCTGLNEETITSSMKRKKYTQRDQPENTEPCSICREEYVDGEDLGSLDCKHDFHAECIKQWLMQKNLCPICKTTGLTP
ncbi:probable E3 ubiquitin-protein ligase RHG1A isoform X2 [Andrographis paniculata]|uniref:probable E3 ubiquitin-protein ligase RHG1A isoform X2 n=1 Tax=Andrographis paniculata TaxID=175694 RepID=UPI0021E73A0A|nr:probable E3 ubiquitin-protein ligase RHG1A isoform X2 [Andrographis paniculata]